MTFWKLFFRVILHKPPRALAAAYWQLTRRRVRARNILRVASADLPFAYSVWIANNENPLALAEAAPRIMADWPFTPRFAVMLLGLEGATARQIEQSERSVRSQLYPHWYWLAEGTDLSGDDGVDGAFLVPLTAGDTLSPTALYYFAEALQTNSGAAVLYGDQDELDEQGVRSAPWFKPQWNREMFLAQDLLLGAVAIDMVATGTRAPSSRSITDTLLDIALEDRSIVHVPHILCHVRHGAVSDGGRLLAVSEKVKPLGATCSDGLFGTIRVTWPIPADPPLVTMIIPTKDKIDLLRSCVTSVLDRTDYENFEVIIVDNASVEKRTADYLTEISNNSKVRVSSYDGSYNFSAINNKAVREARGSYVCLLNNDTEVISPDWLTEMMRYSIRDEVGAVGAKLLYEDNTIQHAGVVIGIGEAAGHAHRFVPNCEPGYFRYPHVAQFTSAVTAACLVVNKEKYDAVGGLDEDELAVAFNDVDFCLKLQAAGWRNVYVPHAVLLHYESKSRGQDVSPLNIDRYRRELATLQERWGTRTYDDPLHNPNLDRYNETYVFSL